MPQCCDVADRYNMWLHVHRLWCACAWAVASALAPMVMTIHIHIQSRVPAPLIDTWNTAAHYHLIHSVALVMSEATASNSQQQQQQQQQQHGRYTMWLYMLQRAAGGSCFFLHTHTSDVYMRSTCPYASLAVASRIPHPTIWSARLFGTGIVLFSGSLYALVLTDVRTEGQGQGQGTGAGAGA